MASKILITGSGGLVGSEAAFYFANKGWSVYGIDNDVRGYLFGQASSVQSRIEELNLLQNYQHCYIDVSHKDDIDFIVRKFRPDVVIHAAAQPSHDWAAKDPHFDFNINAVGTLNLLESVRQTKLDTPFIFTSTNKVYGDTPNRLPLIEDEKRFNLPEFHLYSKGIDETMSIDASTHSLFGVSKVAADLLVQEYGRYFNMPTAVFRCGCITGPAHKGAELHGFLSYLMNCMVSGRPYTIYGYKGKQVRDNIHAFDLVQAFEMFIEAPAQAGAVYNMGGGLESNCSILEAIELGENIVGCKLDYKVVDTPRVGDHKWWITSTKQFKRHYPNWELQYDVKLILKDIYKQFKRF